MGRDGRAGIEFEYALDVFKKNYLADTTDLTGRVSAAERVYRPGTYDQAVVDLTYEHELWKRSRKERKKSRFPWVDRVHGEALVGYLNRRYEGPHGNRDRDGLRAGLEVSLDLASRFDLTFGYLFQLVEAPGGREVLVRDEDDFGADFNGDGDALDQNRRAFEKVDRSHHDHVFDVRFGAEIVKRWYAWVGYEARLQDFESEETFDLSYRSRDDLRHLLSAGLSWEFMKDWEVELQGRWAQERVDRAARPSDEDEEAEYNRFMVALVLTARF